MLRLSPPRCCKPVPPTAFGIMVCVAESGAGRQKKGGSLCSPRCGEIALEADSAMVVALQIVLQLTAFRLARAWLA